MGRITPKLLVLAGMIAGVTACQTDPLKGVESAQDKAQEHALEARQERTELTREQIQEREELAQKQAVQAAEKLEKERGQPVGEQLEDRNALALKQVAERADLGSEQAEERADVQGGVERQHQRDLNRLAEANDEANADKRAFAEKSRERLHELEDRASKLSAKRAEAEPDEQAKVNQTLTELPAKCEQAAREITNLEGASSSTEWTQAKRDVQSSLASIERSLDRVDRLL